MSDHILFFAGIFLGGLILGYLLSRKRTRVEQAPSTVKTETTKKVPQQVTEKIFSSYKQKQPTKPAQPSQPVQKVVVQVHPSCVAQLKNKDEVSCIAWDPKDRFLVATTKNSINLVEVETILEKDHRQVFLASFLTLQDL